MLKKDKKIESNKPAVLCADNLISFNLKSLQEDFEDVFEALSRDEILGNGVLLSGNIDKTMFDRLTLTEFRFKNVNLTDVVFKECKLEDVCFENCGFQRVLFDNCHFYNLNFKNCFLYSVKMQECEGKFTSFPESKLKDCFIVKSKLLDSYFYRCILNKIALEDVDLTNFESAETSFKGVDFSSCRLSGMRVSIEAFRGATLNASAALGLISAFGIKVSADQ